MGKTQLAPGFRFHPTDVELVRYYLKRKVLGKKLLVDAIAEVDIYKFEPPDLPDMSYIKGGDLKWHFLCPREMKYATGVRANRATECGYWKTTGKERTVLCNDEVVGKIKTLVFHFGKSPRGERTDWVMHEYRLEDKVLAEKNIPQDTYVVCVLFKKDGPGPRNGAQYGAPFREEDWSDKEEGTGVPDSNNPANLPNKANSLVVAASQNPVTDCFAGMISESCVSDVQITASSSMLPPLGDEANTPLSAAPLVGPNGISTQADTLNTNYDDIYSMLDLFVDEDEYLRFCDANNNEVRHEPAVPAPVFLDESLFHELPDLSNVHTNNNMPRTPSYDLVDNSDLYLELQDLTAPLAPQFGNHLDDSTNPYHGQNNFYQGHNNSYEGHNFDFSAAANEEDPYDLAAIMGLGPDMWKNLCKTQEESSSAQLGLSLSLSPRKSTEASGTDQCSIKIWSTFV